MPEVSGLARTVDEAHLYMDMHPCDCGSATFPRSSQLHDLDGALVSHYSGDCGGCAKPRSFTFTLPEVPTVAQRSPAYFGDGRSQLLDAGEWLFIADRYAAAVPALAPDAPEDIRVGIDRLGVALEAIEQVLQFVNSETGEIDEHALRSELSLQIWRSTPGRFIASRLLAVRDSYRASTDEYLATLAAVDDN